MLLRGLIAGVVVAGVAAAAGALGPTLAGLAYAFPTTMLAALWVLQRHYGADFTLATMARVPAGIATYAGFCLALHLAAGPLPPLAAWALAVAARGRARAAGARRDSAQPTGRRAPWRSARRRADDGAFDAAGAAPYMIARSRS